MPHVEEDLNEGLRVTRTERGYQLNRTFFCTDLEGTDPVDKLLQPYVLTASGDAHTGGNIPEQWDAITVRGITFYCKSVDVDPSHPADAVVRAVYDTDAPPVAGFGPTQQEAGSSMELAETKFDATNQALAFASRVPISVAPPPSHAGALPQYPTVPYFAGKAMRVYTRQESSDPLPRAKAYVRRRNSSTWKGQAAGTVLCAEIVGRNAGDGIWVTRYVFLIDDEGKFLQVSYWRDQNGNVPEPDFSTGEGVTESDVQGEANFNALNL